MTIKKHLILLAASAFFATACSDDDGYKAPSTVPSVPTQMSLEDGAQISELSVTLNAAGSTVEDEELKVSYVYYIGTSATEMEPTDATVTLEPYTQYFWCAQAKTEVSDGEMTPTRTFYCVPGIKVTTDNGDGINAAIIRWDKADRFKNVTVSATSDHEGYGLESQTVENGVDTCTFLYKRDVLTDTNNAYVHWWDDEHGVYYEPVIYTFNVEATVEVGDTTFILNKSAKEIILDKQWTIRDHEFNVYRVVHLGELTWLADDLRVKSYKNGEPIDKFCTEVTLNSGTVGVLYDEYIIQAGLTTETYGKYSLERVLPKGYHIATHKDWLALEAYYGLTTDKIMSSIGYVPGVLISDTTGMSPMQKADIHEVYLGKDTGVGVRLSGSTDWVMTKEKNTTDAGYPFNAKPFGIGAAYFGDGWRRISVRGQHTGVVYATKGYKKLYRIIWSYSPGISRYYFNFNDEHYCPVRLVKD